MITNPNMWILNLFLVLCGFIILNKIKGEKDAK